MVSHLPEGLSPDAVDILTELTAILTKLRASQNLPPVGLSTPALGGLAPLPGATPGPGLGATSHSQPSGATPAPGPGTTPLPSGTPNTGNGFTARELTTATDNIKHKLQRARAAVKTLPDVHRTVDQQEAEIRELEERRKKQIAMLARLRDEGLQFARTGRDDADRMVVG